MDGTRIHITGIVQGVGFRPFVYNLARKHDLRGWCMNDSEGVVIEVEGGSIEKFIEELKGAPPPLSRIERIVIERVKGNGYPDFSIRESRSIAGRSALVSPDMAVCPECLSELFDPGDRRHLYPFINCTNCGPRYSIVRDIPYDRPRTTMATFRMCAECEREYHDPSNRRFHAQPNACPDCGPRAWLYEQNLKEPHETDYEAIRLVQMLLKNGAIVAIRGLGGFHLACDAENDVAVARLRERKRRPVKKGALKGSNKPFALMAESLDQIRSFAMVSIEEEEAIKSRVRPIVLVAKSYPDTLSGHVAPGNRCYGVMLPYTPLHHLLFNSSEFRFRALVMTSGNLSEEPIVTSNPEALKRLSSIADFFLLHDREIYMRVDDSIVMVEGGRRRVLRRARGFVPEPFALDEETVDIFAAGALLKNTFCLTKGPNAILSTHIGDLENAESLEFYKETLRNLRNTFRAAPVAVAHDMHPDYLSTRFALEYAKENNIPAARVYAVQHHHAHVVAAMAEHGLKERVIGVAFDGAGLGTDGRIWGGEFLIADRKAFTREAHLRYLPLPGGDAAVKEPWRMALSYLNDALGGERALEFLGRPGRIDAKEAATVMKMITASINAPLTSSAGRLFDAIASIIGLRDEISYEAEAAIELESIAEEAATQPYPYEVAGEELDLRPMIRAIAEDVAQGVERPLISGRFHWTVVSAITDVVSAIRDRSGITDVVLSGGVFQNRLLSSRATRSLVDAGFRVWTQEKVPSNDGGLSLGQAIVAWEMFKGGR